MDADSKPIRVLLVDDEQDLVDFLAYRLVKRGYMVKGTNSPSEALDVIQKQLFDVAVVDLKMPEMDGIQVMKAIKEAQPFLEIIMLTGHGSTDSAWKAGKLDAFKYLLKPCDHDDLVATIEAACERKRKLQFERYMEELNEVNASGTPRGILEASERLRVKYEQN